MRRIARQSRSLATVAAIEQAAALIVEGGEDAKLTTNHIAERAGVSIGSLYEYFSSKDDVLRSCCEGEAERMRSELGAIWCASKTGNGRSLKVEMILALPFAPFNSRPALAKAMLRRFAPSPWALDLAQRNLGKLLDLIGDSDTEKIFGITRDKLISRIPILAEQIAAQILGWGKVVGGCMVTRSRSIGASRFSLGLNQPIQKRAIRNDLAVMPREQGRSDWRPSISLETKCQSCSNLRDADRRQSICDP